MDIAKTLLVDDIRAAHRPDSRLGKIVHKIARREALTVLEHDFLRKNDHASLIGYALGELDDEAFRVAALAERARRSDAEKAERERRERKAELEREEADRLSLASERRNAELFAREERKRQRRAILVRFDMPWIERVDLDRVVCILRSVLAGKPVTDADREWLGSEGRDYWTADLFQAHHMIRAQQSTGEWRATRDPWKAASACANWRMADEPEKALAIVREALERRHPPKVHSALLTTGGGALRDMNRFEEARGHGLDAHALSPGDFQPCTLLGAVCLQSGNYAEGIEWYARAEANGAIPASVDGEIRSILAAVRPVERARIREALMARDEDRFRRF